MGKAKHGEDVGEDGPDGGGEAEFSKQLQGGLGSSFKQTPQALTPAELGFCPLPQPAIAQKSNAACNLQHCLLRPPLALSHLTA